MKARALLLGAVASVAMAGSASANNWYVAGDIGINWVDDVDATVLGITGPLSTDAGWAMSAAVGNTFAGGWRLEGEIGYRSNDTTSGTIQVTQWSFMLNLLHDFELSPKLDLSLGAGIGLDASSIDVGGVATSDDTGFAFQGIAGLSYALTSETDLTLTYRYMNVQGPEYSPGGVTISLDDVTQHAVSVGIRIKLSPGSE